MWDKFVAFIHDISDWFEAIGFLVGIVTVIKVFFLNRDVKKLHTKHLFQVRVDEHIKDLKSSSRKISRHLNNFQANLKEIRLEVSKCVEHCNSIKKKVASKDLSNLKPLIKKMKKLRDNKIDSNNNLTAIQKLFRQKAIEETEVDEVYTQINSLITEIEHFNNDLKRTIK
jgi:hypothetical protein